MPTVRCKCGESRPVRVSTDGNGRLVDVTGLCVCVVRRRAGLCRKCPAPVAGTVGRSAYCKPCKTKSRTAVKTRWREANPASVKRARARNRKHRNAVKLAWVRKNWAKVRLQNRASRQRRRERDAAYRKRYEKANKEALRAKAKERYARNRDQRLEYMRASRRALMTSSRGAASCDTFDARAA